MSSGIVRRFAPTTRVPRIPRVARDLSHPECYHDGPRVGAMRMTGWVRNLPDRSVEVVCEGDEPALDRFEHVIRQGPPGARVDSVASQTLPPGLGEAGFTIRDD